MFYLCPDCHDAHAEPLEATLGLQVACRDCVLERELIAAHVEPSERIPRAA